MTRSQTSEKMEIEHFRLEKWQIQRPKSRNKIDILKNKTASAIGPQGGREGSTRGNERGNHVNESRIPRRNGQKDVLSVNMVLLSKKLHLSERKGMLTCSDAESNSTYLNFFKKEELSILKAKREESPRKERVGSFSFGDH